MEKGFEFEKHQQQQQSLMSLLMSDEFDSSVFFSNRLPQLLPPHQPPPPPPDYSIFNHLPDLLTLDTSPFKRPRFSPPPPPPPPPPPRGSQLARKRRQTLSDKTRCLQKLLPWESKMDTATVLESAHRYVRFLEAQLAALRAMPIVASSSERDVLPNLGVTRGGEGEVMWRLSRSQMLQVVVNSGVAQVRMAESGRCLFAVEQLALLNKRSFIRSAMHGCSSSSSSCF